MIDGDGFHFNCLTKPYGFVAPDAKVWFQEFEDTDDFGNVITREYLMTTGYLWTGQFEEAKRVLTKGNSQSMELEEQTLDGYWSTDVKSGFDFFIINDATFSKLCLLGEDVEPCFEGARVTAPQVSNTFSKQESDFKSTLFSMMKELKFALERRNTMENVENNLEQVTATVAEIEFKKQEEEDKEKEKDTEKESDTESKDSSQEDKKDEEDKNEDKEKKKYELQYAELQKSYESLSTEFAKLTKSYEAAQKELAELTEFKCSVEREKKDALIETFYMLSDEDKKDVVENKDKYSLDEIEAKLSVICFRKKVNFDLGETDKNEDSTEDVTTYSLQGTQAVVPAWIKAVQNARDKDKLQ